MEIPQVGGGKRQGEQYSHGVIYLHISTEHSPNERTSRHATPPLTLQRPLGLQKDDRRQ